MSKKEGEVVCVTGASGYIGSWLVQLLLHRGYTVRATVKNLEDEKETKHLEAMEGAESRLRLFQMDLLNYDSIVPAVSGAAGVFHLASPCIVDPVEDPQRELLDPAIKGTINVLTAAKELGVRRVVVTSSISSIIPSPNWPADKVKNEDCWADEEYCQNKGVSHFNAASSFLSLSLSLSLSHTHTHTQKQWYKVFVQKYINDRNAVIRSSKFSAHGRKFGIRGLVKLDYEDFYLR